jgi:ribosomal protein L37E
MLCSRIIRAMAFIKNNSGFTCEHCGELNPPAVKTCRNHCITCLYSKHVDVEPGDRAAQCGGFMKPIAVLPGTRKSDYVLLHKCESCGFERNNRMAEDDDFEKVLEVAGKSVLG